MNSNYQTSNQENISEFKSLTNKDASKVEINRLLANVRIQKKKEKKESIIFVSLVCGVAAVTGIIDSL